MQLHLTLFIAGSGTVRSMTAKRRLEHLIGRLDAEVRLDVVDVLEDPDRAESRGIFATPTLIREQPEPRQRVIGDLLDIQQVAIALGVEQLMAASEVAS